MSVAVPGATERDEPWARLAAAALERVAPAVLGSTGHGRQPGAVARGQGETAAGGLVLQAGDDCAELRISVEAVRVLRLGAVQWLTSLLLELDALSLHRVWLRDGCAGLMEAGSDACRRVHDFSLPAALLAEREEFADRDGDTLLLTRRPSGPTEARAAERWMETLHQRQRLRRIGPADLRAWLRQRRGGGGAGLQLPKALRDQCLRLLEEEAHGAL